MGSIECIRVLQAKRKDVCIAAFVFCQFRSDEYHFLSEADEMKSGCGRSANASIPPRRLLEPLIDMGLMKGPIDMNIGSGSWAGRRDGQSFEFHRDAFARRDRCGKTTPISQANTGPLDVDGAGEWAANVRVGLEDILPADGRMVSPTASWSGPAGLSAP